jgi:3-phosphoshikimate 1-carboxyvinyltransferase
MKKILLKKNNQSFHDKIYLASSKSESNRALIINALCGFEGNLENLSTARDTQTMIRLLQSDDATADVIDAGTTMRFLTAYFSATNQQKTMTGTPRMCERPIGILVDALREIGVEIDYLQNQVYPPIQIKGFGNQKTDSINIRGDVSSQYISAMLMVAPTLANGLKINILGELGSKPYIEMTIAQMRQFGAEVLTDWNQNRIEVKPKKYIPTNYKIESDWSGASYWFSIVALCESEYAEVELIGLKENSLQGDSAIVEIMAQLGVKSTFTTDGVRLTKIPANSTFEYDFTDCPDLTQTVSVCCAAKGIPAIFTGIESLKIKETDRVAAIQNELRKFGGDLIEIETNHKYQIKKVEPSTFNLEPLTIKTYDDHRMAMAFAPLAMLTDIVIEEPNVVVKSYPSFWDDLQKVVEIVESK